MIIQIKHVLGDKELDQIHKYIKDAKFKDGKLSAGLVAKEVKNNEFPSMDESFS